MRTDYRLSGFLGIVPLSLVLLLLSCWQIVLAQPDSLWMKTFRGPYEDYAYSVKQTSDGGFVLAGKRQRTLGGPTDVWYIKTTGVGDTVWTRIVGGGNSDRVTTIIQTADGGYALTGLWGIGAGKPLLIKTDPAGTIDWLEYYAEQEFYPTEALDFTAFQQGGGYVLVGRQGTNNNNEDAFLLHVDGVGDTVWSKIYGGPYNDRLNSVIETADGGIAAAGFKGYAFLTSNPDVWLLRLDSNGDTLWTRTYGTAADAEVAKCIRQTADGGFIITGYKGLFGENDLSDLYLIRTDANGDTLWTRVYADPVKRQKGYAVRETSDGGFVICGYIDFPGNVLVMKVDQNGTLLWQRIFSSPYEARAYDIEITSDNGFILAGVWSRSTTSTSMDMFLMRMEPDQVVGIHDQPGGVPGSMRLIGNYPNPFNPETHLAFSLVQAAFVKLEVYDLAGKKIKTLVNGRRAAGHYTVVWNGTNQAGQSVGSGVYFYRLSSGIESQTRKMLLLK
ncbi:MAG: T9SS C-terminal target domain-containing protein [Calditrichaeota bacterium]|nr:MAG: T9SS C-terminal target domain-containing protein [Calditrichota bacterium]